MNILITGGAGYIGSHTIVELIDKSNFDIISVDNFINSSSYTFERIKKITGKKIKNYNCDITKKKEFFKIFEDNKIDGIIHFAALKSVPESVQFPLKYYNNNLISLINILEAINLFKIKYLIFSSSCSVYGNPDNLPVTENTALKKAESPYAYTKQIGEKMIEDFCKVNPNFKAISLRYFNPVGAHISGKLGELPINPPNNLLPIITETAIGKRKILYVYGNDYNTRDGTCIRDYIHVSDIAEAHLLALNKLIENKNIKNYDIYNLGTGKGVTVLEIINSFEKVTGKKLNYKIAPRRKGDVPAVYANNEKAKKYLLWKSRYSIDDMLLSAWKWQINLCTE